MAATYYQGFAGQSYAMNTDSLEERFIPIKEESTKDYPNFDIDKKYPGEWLIKENVPGFDNVATAIAKFMQVHKAIVISVNDYEIVLKSENNSYIQMSIRNIDSDTYYMITGPLRQWLDSIKDNPVETKKEG